MGYGDQDRGPQAFALPGMGGPLKDGLAAKLSAATPSDELDVRPFPDLTLFFFNTP